ncbi:MAG: prolyl oligopeptidase family serine peptidase [Halolamina sp.]
MTTDGTHDESERGDVTLSRRAFAKATGGAAMIAGASTPAVADELRTERRAANRADAVDPVAESFTPTRWVTVGPFQYQRRGTSVGWLFPEGGGDALATGATEPTAGDALPSAFAGGSSVTWRQVDADGSTVRFPQASEEIDPTGGGLTPLIRGDGLFDDYQDWFGAGGVLYGIGYAFTTVEMDAPRRAVLESDATVWLNGRKYEEPPSGVVLEAGTNYLLAKGFLIFGRFGAIDLAFRPPRAPVEATDPAPFRGTPQNVVVPDLRVGEDDTDLPALVRVTNTTADPVENATLTFAPDDAGDGDLLVTQTVDVDPPLAPFETRRVNTRVRLPGAAGDEPPPSERAETRARAEADTVTVPPGGMVNTEIGEKLRGGPAERGFQSVLGGSTATFDLDAGRIAVRAEVGVTGATDCQEVPLRVRGTDEDRRQSTFVSRHDESVQSFSLRRPANAETGSPPWDLIVSLHGANVPSINQAGANVSREDAYVVAPGARGPVNYDHEDLGRLDDLEAMAVMKDRFDIDDDRVYLSGHSMGGHGTWHLGLMNPKHFAALGPSSGWTDHETYITVVWGRDKLHAYPGLKAVKETSLQKNLAMPKTQNAQDGTLPVFVLHGGQDRTVPTMQPRSYLRTLANRGLDVRSEVGLRFSTPDPAAVDVAYLEVPDADHYWNADEFGEPTIGPGKDTINHPDLWNFLRSAERDRYPEQFSFYTTNLRVEHEKAWVAVHEQETVHAPTKVEAEVTDEGLDVVTYNVARLTIDPAVFEAAGGAVPRRVVVNGQRCSVPRGADRVGVDLTDGLTVRADPEPSADGQKGPDQYGPLREVHHDPYRLVYGTQGDDAETALNRNLANVRSQRLVDRARAPATVIPDTAVTAETMRRYNLVLFGRPSSNAVLDRLQGSLPVTVRDGTVAVGDRTYTGDLGVEYVYPNPRAEERLLQIETGTTPAGARLTRARDWTPTQVGTADYMVFDGTISYQKWNACLAAGFFDKRWRVDESLGHLRDVDSTRARPGAPPAHGDGGR